MELQDGIDISIPFSADPKSTSAWYVGPMKVEPVKGDGFVGSVALGGSVNFRDLTFNPHGNGTHTECVGHIAPECFSVNQHLKKWMFNATLISIKPEQRGEDQIITKDQFQKALLGAQPEAVVLRTLPNDSEKLRHNYSNTNPPYLDADACKWLRQIGVEHLLLDLPSVDKEVDGGALTAHKAFWNYPENPRMTATITEFIYVPSGVEDGPYLLNLQVAPIENDAAPSRPVLYPR